MSNLVIVAIPSEGDLVWEVSTEKVPHLTLLFLGETGKVQNVDKILGFLEHASQTTLSPFYLNVDHRGTLGDDEADVLFFDGGWDLPVIREFRGALLKNDAISKAYISEEQFPEWTPHLTLGYPTKPAKKTDREFYDVRFDRIALWLDDYEGPEFRLRHDNPDPMEVSMTTVDDILAQSGVKGMKWGVRKDRTPTDVKVATTAKGKLKITGGKNQPTHKDAIVAKVAVQKARKSGLKSLSNQEMKDLVKRMDLETKVKELKGNPTASNGKQVVEIAMAVAQMKKPG